MKTLDEQMDEILLRSDQLIDQKAKRRAMAYKAVSVCAAFFIVLAAAFLMPGVIGTVQPSGGSVYGGMVRLTPHAGYIVVGVLAFLLGLCAAILCRHFDKMGR